MKYSIQTTGEKAACFHDATSAFDHEDNLDEQSDKQGHTRTDRAAIYGKYSDQKESSVDWTHQVSSGHRKRGRPRLRFKDTIKRNMKLRDIKTDSRTSLS